MNYYKLRLDHSDEHDLNSVLTMLEQYTSSYCYCIEKPETDNEHYHFYLEMTCHPTTLRVKIKQMGYSGNASYSLKQAEERYPLEYLSYMMKEGQFVNSGIPEDILEGALAHSNKVKQEIKEKKEARKGVLEKLWEQVQVKIIDSNVTAGQHYKIFEIIIQYHLFNKLLIREFQIKAYYDTILARLDINNMFSMFDRITRVAMKT